MSFYTDASLVMIPSGYKTSKVYSAKPVDGSGDLDFTRSNDTATRVNSSGLIEKVRQNQYYKSTAFTTSSLFATYNVSPVSLGTYPVNSSSLGYSFSITGTNQGFIVQLPNDTNIRSVSVYLKDWNTVDLYWTGSAPITTISDTGTINGYKRYVVVIPAGANNLYFRPNSNSGTATTVYATAPQIENGDYPTAYIVNDTTASAVSVGPVANLPRLDYSGGATCPSLKLEPQRSNLCLWSEAFDNAAWTKDFNGAGSAPVITANYTTSPDGYQNADRIQFSSSTATSSDYSIVSQPIALGSTGTFSLYVKSLTSSTQNLLVYWGGGQGDVFEVTTEWTRITLAGLAVQTTYVIFGTRGESGNYYNGGDATLDIAVWGAQLEEGAYATSYIPTLSAAVTRGADMSGTTDYFGAQTFAGDFAFFVDLLPMEGNTAISDAMILGGGDYNGGGNFQSYFRFASGNIVLKGVAEALVIVRSYTMTANQQYKILVTRTGTTVKIFANGAQVGASATSSVSVILRSLGWSYIQASYNYDGRINQVLLMPSGLTDAQAIELTTI